MQEETSPPPPVMQQQEPELVPLEKLPTPPFVLVMAVVTLVAFAIGVVRFPGALSAGISYERGSKSYDAGDYNSAIKNLEPVVKAYPDATDAQIDLAGAYTKTDRFEEAVGVMKALEGKEVSKERYDKLNEISSELDGKIKQLDDAQGGGK